MEDEGGVEVLQVGVDALGVVVGGAGDLEGAEALQMEADDEVFVGEHAAHVEHGAGARQDDVVLALV
jgi:hypothetical protein